MSEKIKIRLDDPETRALWDTAQRAKQEVASWPAWKRGDPEGRPPCVKCGFSPDAVVSARWEVVLDKRIESANNRTVNAGATRWRYAKQRDEWTSWIRARARGILDARPSEKRRVTITRRYAGRCRLLDKDNLVGGCKALVDAMVHEGVVHDDKPQWLELHVLQEQGAKNETHVLVEELA